MGLWQLTCPKGGKYECEGHYVGGHGKPFALHCSTIKTLKGPEGGACLDAPLAEHNPRTRGFLPHGLTACEKSHGGVRRKLSRCIKAAEVRCCGHTTKHYESCSCNPVAVCRASVPCPS